MANTFKKNNYLIVYLIIIGVINLYLQTLPLTNVFGYEFSAINALLLSFLSGLFSITYLKSLVKENQKFNVENFISALRWMIFLPFAISVINSIYIWLLLFYRWTPILLSNYFPISYNWKCYWFCYFLFDQKSSKS